MATAAHRNDSPPSRERPTPCFIASNASYDNPVSNRRYKGRVFNEYLTYSVPLFLDIGYKEQA
jgi:hypothetical protein